MCDKEFLAFKDCVQVCRVTGLDGPLTVIAESRRKAVVILLSLRQSTYHWGHALALAQRLGIVLKPHPQAQRAELYP